jgi:hypothetical protein
MRLSIVPFSRTAGRSGWFSRSTEALVSAAPDRLIVHRLGPVAWNDLGDCNRAVDALLRAGFQPDWVQRWLAAESAVSTVA